MVVAIRVSIRDWSFIRTWLVCLSSSRICDAVVGDFVNLVLSMAFSAVSIIFCFESCILLWKFCGALLRVHVGTEHRSKKEIKNNYLKKSKTFLLDRFNGTVMNTNLTFPGQSCH